MNHWNIDRKNPFEYKNIENTICFWSCTNSFLQEHLQIIQDNNHPCDIWIPILNPPDSFGENKVFRILPVTLNYLNYWELNIIQFGELQFYILDVFPINFTFGL